MPSFSSYQRKTENAAASSNKSNLVIQPKLTVNTPNDRYEQEADAVADRVMRMPEPSRTPSVSDAPFGVSRLAVSNLQRKCAHCEEKEKLQRKETGTDVGGMSAPASVYSTLSSGGGHSLDKSTQRFMESRFNRDFSQVRVHTGTQAASSAHDIQARAYTSGNNIVFGKGEYQPNTEGGKRLLAHELVHTVQQAGGGELNGDSIQRQLTSFPEKEEESKKGLVSRKIDPLKISNTFSTQIQRRGGTTVGRLCVKSNVVGQGLTDGHAWLSYTPVGGSETTYGTWGNRAPIGLHRNLEVGYTAAASLCQDIDAVDYASLTSFATSNNAWSYYNNCASFAGRGWNSIMGDSLAYTSYAIPNPSALGTAIAARTAPPPPSSGGKGGSSIP